MRARGWFWTVVVATFAGKTGVEVWRSFMEARAANDDHWDATSPADGVARFVDGVCRVSKPYVQQSDLCRVAWAKVQVGYWWSVALDTVDGTRWCMGTHCREAFRDAHSTLWWLTAFATPVLTYNFWSIAGAAERWFRERPARRVEGFVRAVEQPAPLAGRRRLRLLGGGGSTTTAPQ